MARNVKESEKKIMGLFLDRDSIQIFFVEIFSEGFCVILLTSQPTNQPSKKPADEHMKHKPPWWM